MTRHLREAATSDYGTRSSLPRAGVSIDRVPDGRQRHLQRTIGNQAVRRLMQSGTLRAKTCASCAGAQRCPKCEEERGISVGPADDVFEREADAIAARVGARVQRARVEPGGGVPPTPSPAAIAAIRHPSGGIPLRADHRARIEPEIGMDLSGVRVHVDEESSALAAELSAKAFTYRNHIFLGAGARGDDLGLIAHEAAHVAQQDDGTDTGRARPSLRRTPDDRVQRQPCEDPADVVRIGLGLTPRNGPTVGMEAQRLTFEEFERLTGARAANLPENTFVGADRLDPLRLASSQSMSVDLAVSGAKAAMPAAVAGAPLPMAMIPPNSMGVLWTQGHTSIFANVDGVLTIRGYRATLAMHLGEILPGPAGRWFGQQLTAGVPGAFRTDTLFALMPGQQHVIFLETDPATAAEFATELSAREAGGMYRYSPPRPSAEASRMEKPLGPSERLMYERVYQSRGGPRAVLCTNNCITVPLAEFERILGTNPKVRTGEGLFDVATGKFASGESDPYMHGRARLMTEYMENPKVAGGREGLKIPMTPAASRAVGYIRVGGIVFMFYALYQTEERLRAAYGTDAFPLVLASEGFSWAGGIAGTAAGAGIASGLACMMLGPVTLACVATGFIVTFIAGGVGALLGALVVPVSIWLAESIVDVTHSGVGRVAEGLDLIRGFGRGLTESLIVIPILTARQSVNPCNWELIGLPPRTRGDITALGLFWWSQFGRQRPNEFAAHMRQTIGSYAVPPNLLRDIAAGLSAAARAGTGWNITFTPEFIAGITPLEFVNQLHAYNLLRYRYDPRTLAELSTRR